MFDPAFYGDTWASIYDDVHARLDPAAAVEVLAQLAGTGKALELGIGTGRVAIPLAARGIAVHGIEASRAMLDRMRVRPRTGQVRRISDTRFGRISRGARGTSSAPDSTPVRL